MQDLRTELAATVDEAEWEWLIPHAQRQALIVVSQELDLIDVALAMASDNVSSVQGWIGGQLIYKPSTAQLSDWNANRNKRFNSLIVQPFVLVQEPAAA
ncbi:MAG: DUF2288 domain-containing protein [Oscillatoria princeps RMCB-10]|jgi:hypothetical protein|nr:DUF2288 domain-containing protein [Oscillatoria princeps RMCB-10]